MDDVDGAGQATPEPVRRVVVTGASTARQRSVPLAAAAALLILGVLVNQAGEKELIKVLYKPAGILVSVLGTVLAGAICTSAWKLVVHEDITPKAVDAQQSWREIMTAAALPGAILALVKAVADRGVAEGTRKLTGIWPGEGGQQPGKEA